MKMIFITVGCLFIMYILYVAVYFIWWSRNFYGLSYYGKLLSERRNIKKKVIQYGKVLIPFQKILSLIIGDKLVTAMPQYEGMTYSSLFFPKKRIIMARSYKPQSEDIFIVTQQRSGTTWTQQIVYEILSRGKGDLGDRGHISLYAVSPWIESAIGVTIEKAPLVGEKKNRVIKSHLPSYLCPYSEDAKYIYIARHPVSCCASCYDWWTELAKPFMCSMEKFIDLFCSDQFTFSPWPKHVDGYWQWTQNKTNILFFHFEEMKQDLTKVIEKMTNFLGYDLTDGEVSMIAEKSSFKYMSEHWELFEMSPPMPYFSDQPFFKGGSLKRKNPFNDAQKKKIFNYCRDQLKNSSYPFDKFYPEI